MIVLLTKTGPDMARQGCYRAGSLLWIVHMSPKDSSPALPGTSAAAAIWRPILPWLAPVLLVVVVLLPYSQVGSFSFVNYDDPLHIGMQQEVLSGLNADSLRWALTATPSNLWHPLTWMSYMAEVSFFGGGSEAPSVHHRGNLVLHLACVLIVYAIMRALAIAPLLAMLTAMLYAVHPLHAEPVSWISARKDVLSGVFSLSAVWMYLLHRKQQDLSGACLRVWKHRGLLLLVFVFLFLALCSKPSSVVVPLLMIVAYGFLQGDEKLAPNPVPLFGREALSLWPCLLLAGLAAAIAVSLQHSGSHGQAIQHQSVFDRLLYLPALVGFYGWRTIFPWGLVFDYPVPRGSALIGFYALGILMMVGVLLAWRWRRLLPGVALAGLWFFICLLPVMGFFYVGTSFSSDRYLYLALVGPAIGLARLVESRKAGQKKACMAVLALLTGLFVILAHQQVAVWKNDAALFGHAVVHEPESLSAQTNMASYYRTTGDESRALHHYQKALAVAPYDHIANYNIADIHYRNGEWLQAGEAALRALRSVPRFDRAHYLLGRIYSDQSRPDSYAPKEAFKHFELAYRLAPRNPKYAYAYAGQLASSNRRAEALEVLKRGASVLDPTSPWLPSFQKGIRALSR